MNFVSRINVRENQGWIKSPNIPICKNCKYYKHTGRAHECTLGDFLTHTSSTCDKYTMPLKTSEL